MNEDMSSRQEWYEGEDNPHLLPDELRPLVGPDGVRLPAGMPVYFGGALVGFATGVHPLSSSGSFQSNHFSGSAIDVRPRQFGKLAEAAQKVSEAIGVSAHAILEAFTKVSPVQSNYVLFPPPLNPPNFDDWKPESVRDRALRLKQQPHWQSQNPDDFHFDHRGRRRY